ncbi:MAG TPA: hypothetical protein PLZ51_09880, partial [Aggregatilineales bacterium]|nr:hypothetical protein [Aggregatilineales bacterium]
MSISQTNQEKLKQATIDYFQSFKLIHDWDIDESENLQQHCLMQLFEIGEFQKPSELYAPMEKWELYLSEVGSLTQNRVQRKSIG